MDINSVELLANFKNQTIKHVEISTANIPDKGPSPYASMEGITVTPNGVEKLLRDLKPDKATGPDMIPARLLKQLRDVEIFLDMPVILTDFENLVSPNNKICSRNINFMSVRIKFCQSNPSV